MLTIGERISIPEEGIEGVIDEIYYDDEGAPASLVIECDDGLWAAVEVSEIDAEPVTIH